VLLNISFNNLTGLSRTQFGSIGSVGTLDMKGNDFHILGNDFIGALLVTRSLLVDSAEFCCLSKNIQVCRATRGYIHCRYNLIKTWYLRLILCLAGAASLALNLTALVHRANKMIKEFQTFPVLIINICLSDILMP